MSPLNSNISETIRVSLIPVVNLCLSYRHLLLVCFLIASSHLHADYELKAAAQNSPPKYFLVEQNGIKSMRGLGVDIMAAIEKAAPGIKFSRDNYFIPTARIFNYLGTGEIDVYIGAGSNKERLEEFVFLDIPLYAVNHVVVVRRDDDVDVKSFDDIRLLGNKGRLMTLFGTATHRYLIKQKGLLISTKSTVPGLLAQMLVARQKARPRFIYYHDLGLIHNIKKQNLADKLKLLPVVFNKYHHFVVFSKKVPEPIVEKIRVALAFLVSSGELETICSRYM